MSLTIFATAEDLAGWPCTVPTDSIDRYLRTATYRIARACNIDPYDYTPPDTAIQPLKDATCAQICSWVTLGIDPAAAGLDSSPVKKSSILTGDVERDTTGQAAALAGVAAGLASEAQDILLQAGLLWQPVATTTTDDCLPHYGLSASPLGFSPTFANSADAWPFW